VAVERSGIAIRVKGDVQVSRYTADKATPSLFKFIAHGIFLPACRSVSSPDKVKEERKIP